jgi:membrane peptidoglycan carboxypeptidase
MGLRGPRLLEGGDPSNVVYSFSLYESLGDRNVLRMQTDNGDSAFSVNESVRLDLGSTAKLRTLATYLDIIAALHLRYGGQTRADLRQAFGHAHDPLTRWALERLYLRPDETLPAFLDAAMARKHSASPHEQFFTGGGRHHFRNFDKESDERIYSVENAFRNSVNLVFIRLMREIAHYYMYGPTSEGAAVIADRDHPARTAYLERFADFEGRVFLNRFYRRLHGKDRDEMLAVMLPQTRLTPWRLATILRAYDPEADLNAFRATMTKHLEGARLANPVPMPMLSDEEIDNLYRNYDPARFTLADIGYLSRVHPLELWLARYLSEHPEATRSEVMEASADLRLEVYRWLLKTRRKPTQDTRIRQMLEREAFDKVLASWKRYGYPFDTMTPSYAASIGASGDRPSSLAQLVGIIVNDGRRLPAARVERLRFAEGTPYETVLTPRQDAAERVTHPAVAAVLRRAMVGVVDGGTARRAAGSLAAADGRPLVIGGKTGTGDHVYRVFSAGGEVVDERAVSRAATFVYFIGDRYFGVITTYVTGLESQSYSFTSSLPVQLFRALSPIIEEVVAPTAGEPALDTADTRDSAQASVHPAGAGG